MSKIKAGTASIECGNKILKMIEPVYANFKKIQTLLSEDEQETTKSLIGSQLGLVCEYYLKGLIIPNIDVVIPDELKDDINSLSEEQELMIIVSDEEKIKNDPVLSRLNKKQLRLLMEGNSIKYLGHSLINLLGSKTREDNKRIYLKETVRGPIVSSLRTKLHDENIKTYEEMLKFMYYLSEPLAGSGRDEHLINADKIIEDEVSKSSISEAFPKGRYGIFDGFSPDIDALFALSLSIREGIKHQYPNMIQLLDKNNELIGKYIYPDPETIISVIEVGEQKKELRYKMVPSICWTQYTEILWNVESTTESGQLPRKNIYLDKTDENSKFVIQYICDGQKITLQSIDGEICEISREQIDKNEHNFDNNETR